MAKKFNVKRNSWEMYSAYLNGKDGFYTALGEFLSNAIDAVANSKVKVIDIRVNSRSVSISDTGCGMTEDELCQALQYGESTQSGANNEYGTGIKTGFSFFDPVNGAFSIETTTPSGSYKVEGPYDETMETVDIASWKYGDVSTVMSSALTCKGSIPSNKEIYNWLTIAAKGAIRSGIEVNFNGSIVVPVEPSTDVDEILNKSFPVFGRKKEIDVEHYRLDKNSFWTPKAETQGIYLYVNNRFVGYQGLDLVPNGRNGFTHKGIHNEYNSLVSFVYLTTPNTAIDKKTRLPINSCKTSIDWDSPIGSQYRKGIGLVAGEPYKKEAAKYRLAANAAKASRLAVLPAGAAFTKNCWIDDRKTLKVPAIIFETANMQDATLISKLAKEDNNELDADVCDNNCVDTFVFFAATTSSPVNYKDVSEAMVCIAAFNEAYGYIPNKTLIYGNGITDDAKSLVTLTGGFFNIEVVDFPSIP